MEKQYNLDEILKPKYIDGIPFTLRARDIDMEVMEKLRRLELRSSDVFIAGFPRAG